MNGQCFTDHFVNDTFQNEQDQSKEQLQTVEYNIVNILNFLQNEWSKIGIERSKWEYEKAELEAKIIVLQNERKGQENLKMDLVRRIKMLEYALKKERLKNHMIKYPNESELEPTDKSDMEKELSHKFIDSIDEAAWHQDRLRLRQHIKRVGLSDKLVESRLSTIKELLGINEGNTISNPSEQTGRNKESEAVESVLAGFSFLNAEEPETSATKLVLNDSACNEDAKLTDATLDTEDVDTAFALAEFDRLVAQQSDSTKSVAVTAINPRLTQPDVSSTLDSSTCELDIDSLKMAYADWLFGDQSDLTDRLGLPFGRFKCSKLATGAAETIGDTAIAGFDEVEIFAGENNSIVSRYASLSTSSGSSVYNDSFEAVTSAASGTTTNMLDKAAQASASVTDSTNQGSSFGLGDLASLTVANEADPGRVSALDNLDGVGGLNCPPPSLPTAAGDCGLSVNATAVSRSVTWTAKYTLRSHFDSIRAIIFHSSEQVLLTGSEDHTLKLWNLNKTVQAKKSSCLDVEPIYTCRGHNAPVLCLAMTSFMDVASCNSLASTIGPAVIGGRQSPAVQNTFAFSGALNGEIRSWRFSDIQLQPYEAFDAFVNGPVLHGHSDAVWSLAVRSDGLLLSASADGSVRLWHISQAILQEQSVSKTADAMATCVCASKLYFPATLLPDSASATGACPTSIAFLASDPSLFAVGLTSGHVCVLSVDSGRLITIFDSQDPPEETSRVVGSVNSLASHPSLALLIAGYEDGRIRFLDTDTGKCAHSMVAHLDSVTSIAVDSQGHLLLSASHDSSLRLWDIETKTCIQELTNHRKKFDESIHCVAFHPLRTLMASAGVDALAKIYA